MDNDTFNRRTFLKISCLSVVAGTTSTGVGVANDHPHRPTEAPPDPTIPDLTVRNGYDSSRRFRIQFNELDRDHSLTGRTIEKRVQLSPDQYPGSAIRGSIEAQQGAYKVVVTVTEDQVVDSGVLRIPDGGLPEWKGFYIRYDPGPRLVAATMES